MNLRRAGSVALTPFDQLTTDRGEYPHSLTSVGWVNPKSDWKRLITADGAVAFPNMALAVVDLTAYGTREIAKWVVLIGVGCCTRHSRCTE